MPLQIRGPGLLMLQRIASALPLAARVVMANLWLFGPIVRAALWRDSALRALFWTTQAATLVRGGIKSNVVPQVATAAVNFRIAPWESADEVLAHVHEVLGRDALLAGRVAVTADLAEVLAPSPVTSPESFGYAVVEEALMDAFARPSHSDRPPWLPDLLVAPSLTVGNTGTCFCAGRGGLGMEIAAAAGRAVLLGAVTQRAVDRRLTGGLLRGGGTVPPPPHRHAALLELDRLHPAAQPGSRDARGRGADSRRRRAHLERELHARDLVLSPRDPSRPARSPR